LSKWWTYLLLGAGVLVEVGDDKKATKIEKLYQEA
jgi:hypothetical protein